MAAGNRSTYKSNHPNRELAFRKNVSAVLFRKTVAKQASEVEIEFLLCRRKDGFGWQTVQGGVEKNDLALEAAVLRECMEELGESQSFFKVFKRSKCWRRYFFLPTRNKKNNEKDKFDGQDQMFFLVQVLEGLKLHSGTLGKVMEEEFDKIEWVNLSNYLRKFSSFKKPSMIDFLCEVELYQKINIPNQLGEVENL